MIRQLAMGGLNFHTPKYNLSVQGYSERSCKHNLVDISVTEERQIILTKPEVDAKFSETNVDILGYVDDIPFVVYIKHKDRQVPPELDPPSVKKCGVVAIDISGLPALFQEEREGRYIDVLRKFIEGCPEGKSWIYHPRTAKARSNAEAKMEQWLSEQKAYPSQQWIEPALDISFPRKQPKSNALGPPERKAQYYQCVMCKASWRGISPHCKKCDTHLFAKVVSGNEGET